jgi:formylglycine-generating enzyme required for sulfatase activity
MRKIALLIGVSEYKKGLDRLPQADKDADDLYRVLVDPQLGEFLATNIMLLKNPNKLEMEYAIEWLFDDRKKDDLLLFYFAGHGVLDDKDHLYLTATDTFMKEDGRLSRASAVNSTALLDGINNSKAERKVIILDACYSGAIAQGLTGRGAVAVKLKESLGGKGAAILASSSNTERTWDGMYTRFLVEGIETGAADLDKDGWISLEDLHNYVSERVRDASAKMTMTPRFIPIEDRGHTIRLAKSPTDLKFKYERLIQEEYADPEVRELSGFVRSILLGKQQEWGISPTEAAIIEERVLLYRNKLIEYEQGLTSAIQKQYPLSAKFQAQLTEFQKYFKLRDEDIAEIHRRVLPQSEPTQSNPPPDPIPKPSSPLPTEIVINLFTFSFETAQVKVNSRLSGTKIEITKIPGSAQHFVEQLGNGVTLEMVYVPGGQFMMGSLKDRESSSNERPQHPVNIPAFLMSKYPVTQAQYETIIGNNPSDFKGSQRPVESVSWDDAQAFCQKLSKQTNKPYRLPSEAEWEYACRAGTKTPFCFGENISPDLVNYNGDDPYGKAPTGLYREASTDVGIFPANSFGLYDLHGNVWEWCQDTWHENYQGAPNDGSPWVNNNHSRLLRGGSWLDFAWNCRSANRYWNTPSVCDRTFGFRLALCTSSVSGG